MMLTPIEKVGNYYVKRNDLFTIGNYNGGKAEGAYNLIQNGVKDGYDTFVTCGSRYSPQCDIVSGLCEMLNLQCHVFMPMGAETKVIQSINEHKNTTLHRVKAGYNNVLQSRAYNFAKENDYCLIPFGMKCKENIGIIANQVENIPNNIKRIVVPVGSGVTFCGVVEGLNRFNREDVEVLGVITGADPSKTISTFIPKLFNKVKYSLVKYDDKLSPSELYATRTDESIEDIKLDPIYEGKCKKFLKTNDLMWIVGYHEL